MKIRIFFLVFATPLLFSGEAYGQRFFSGGILPKINLSTKFSPKIKWVNSIESRSEMYRSWINVRSDRLFYKYILTDIASLVSLKTGVASSINAGAMVRFREGQVFLRLIQQFTLVQKLGAGRIGHRFAADQTLTQDRLPTYRLRYRFTLEKPLNGEKIDPKEWYLKVNNEYLGILDDGDAALEIRIVPMLGQEINKHNKVEIGLDYRLRKAFQYFDDGQLWLRATWYISLGRKG